MTPAFVNTCGTFPGAASPAFVATAGNLIVVGCRYNDSPTGLKTITGMTDTAGNTYVSAGIRVNDSVNDLLEVWYAENCLGHATNVVTAAFSATPNFIAILVGQYSGIASSSALDVAVSCAASGTNTVSSNALTTTQADALIVGFGQVAATGGTWTIPSGMLTTVRGSDPSTVMVLADVIVSSIQTGVVATVRSTSGAAKTIVTVAFKAQIVDPSPGRVTQTGVSVAQQSGRTRASQAGVSVMQAPGATRVTQIAAILILRVLDNPEIPGPGDVDTAVESIRWLRRAPHRRAA